MQAYKFTTKVSAEGMVSLAEVPDAPSPQLAKGRSTAASDFVDKWTGVLITDKDPDDLKYDYLMEKYK
jgi:hypothetical protein